MITPYTTKTGIRIGCRYKESPIPQPITDRDMLELQTELLTPEFTKFKRKAFALLDGISLLLLVCLIALLIWSKL